MCAKANAAAAGFSISGLLDAQTKTRERYPVVEIDINDIEDHPSNGIYSMDEAEIRLLADSIARYGLTDLPLVRKLENGHWQMLSGHRRRAAFALLAETDPAFQKIPCRVVESITDAQALALLHTANLFTRQLSLSERAAASRALGVEVEQLRACNPELSGLRTEDIKAAIITQQTGRKVSGKTIKRQEDMARRAAALGLKWQALADQGMLSSQALKTLESLSDVQLEQAYEVVSAPGISKREATSLVTSVARQNQVTADPELVRAERALSAYVSARKHARNERERELIASLRLSLAKLEGGE